MTIFSSLKTRIVFVSGLAIALIAAALMIAGAQMQAEVESRYEAEAFNGKRLLWQRILDGRFDVMRGEIFSITRNTAVRCIEYCPVSSLQGGVQKRLKSQVSRTVSRPFPLPFQVSIYVPDQYIAPE